MRKNKKALYPHLKNYKRMYVLKHENEQTNNFRIETKLFKCISPTSCKQIAPSHDQLVILRLIALGKSFPETLI